MAATWWPTNSPRLIGLLEYLFSLPLASIYYSPKGYWKGTAAIQISQTQQRSRKMWPGAGLRNRPSSRSTLHDQNSISPRRTRSTKLTSSFCRMIRSDAKHVSMPSPWSTSPADLKRLSLWLQKRPTRWPKHCPAFTGGDL